MYLAQPNGLSGDSISRPDGSLRVVQNKEVWKEILPNIRLVINFKGERLKLRRQFGNFCGFDSAEFYVSPTTGLQCKFKAVVDDDDILYIQPQVCNISLRQR